MAAVSGLGPNNSKEVADLPRESGSTGLLMGDSKASGSLVALPHVFRRIAVGALRVWVGGRSLQQL